MNSSAEAQVLRRGVVPKIAIAQNIDAYIAKIAAERQARHDRGGFDEFDTFEGVAKTKLLELANLDIAAWRKHARSFLMGGGDDRKRSSSDHNRKANEARGKQVNGADLREVRKVLVKYIQKTGTSMSAFSKACGRCHRYVSSLYNGNCQFIYEATRNNILDAISRGPLGFNSDGSPIEVGQ